MCTYSLALTTYALTTVGNSSDELRYNLKKVIKSSIDRKFITYRQAGRALNSCTAVVIEVCVICCYVIVNALQCTYVCVCVGINIRMYCMCLYPIVCTYTHFFVQLFVYGCPFFVYSVHTYMLTRTHTLSYLHKYFKHNECTCIHIS